MAIKIETNVPMPEKARNGRSSETFNAMKAMSIGESFTTVLKPTTIKAYAVKAKIRVVLDKTGEKLRVWRKA